MDTPLFSRPVTEKARQILDAGGVRPVGGYSFAVTSTSGRRYLVTLHPARCTCPHGRLRHAPRCSHVAAAGLFHLNRLLTEGTEHEHDETERRGEVARRDRAGASA